MLSSLSNEKKSKDTFCNLQADRERHRKQAVQEGREAEKAERWKQFLETARQAGPPCSWLLMCFK